eukprot:Anaeramoba_ignava/c17358_g1_i2.p1 GENE.c17358_g1_i2~~c17358_g1_i2.p1  ORF type:complete len:110 (-),score=36.02 c17358_g1_i2:31-360(-)
MSEKETNEKSTKTNFMPPKKAFSFFQMSKKEETTPTIESIRNLQTNLFLQKRDTKTEPSLSSPDENKEENGFENDNSLDNSKSTKKDFINKPRSPGKKYYFFIQLFFLS